MIVSSLKLPAIMVVESPVIAKYIGPKTPNLPAEIEHKQAWKHCTFTVQDALNPDESATLKSMATGFSVPSDLTAYAAGMSMEDMQYNMHIAMLDVGAMKLKLGIIGSITDKICAIVDKELLPS